MFTTRQGAEGLRLSPSTGAPRADIDLAAAASAEENTAILYGSVAGEGLGTMVDGTGDISGDGIDDLLLLPGPWGLGTLRVFFGGST